MLKHKKDKMDSIAPRRIGGGLQNDKITVAVALSGGVDSACAAALLKKQGYRVIAFFMKNWSDTFGLKESECPWVQDRQDAMRVAAKLDIPFHTLDFEKEYKREVLDYFFCEYRAGRTPNPDVLCNSQIKFGAFLEKALSLGADYIATGHYTRLLRHSRDPFCHSCDSRNPDSEPYKLDSRFRGNDNRVCQLLKAKDKNKDQTYFLHRLTQPQLAKSIFPIGDYTKPQVRRLAKKLGLPSWNKKDSQGLCFVGHIRLKQFLSQKIKERPGDIVWIPRQSQPRTGFGARNDKEADGKIVGRHQGLFWYTIGQRQGIGIGGTGPFYVMEKDLKNNRLIVTRDRNDSRFWKKEVDFTSANWIAGEEPKLPLRCQGRIRYREALAECVISAIPAKAEPAPHLMRGIQTIAYKLDSRPRFRGGGLYRGNGKKRLKDNKIQYRAAFTKPVWAPSAGQSVVFYKGEICLGGGIIA